MKKILLAILVIMPLGVLAEEKVITSDEVVTFDAPKPDTPTDEAIDKTCHGFKVKIKTCAQYKCMRDIRPGNSLDNYFLGHEITGYDEDRNCHHIQTVADGTIDCHYSQKTMKIMNRLAETTGEPSTEDKIHMNGVFKKECMFIDKKPSEKAVSQQDQSNEAKPEN